LIIVGLFFVGTAVLLAFVLLPVLGQGGRGRQGMMRWPHHPDLPGTRFAETTW